MHKMSCLLGVIFALSFEPVLADSVKARVETKTTIVSGKIVDRVGDTLSLQSDAGDAVKLSTDDVVKIKFSIKDWDSNALAARYLTRDFVGLYNDLNMQLVDYVDYSFCESDLTESFFYLMVSAYWRDDFDLALKLGNSLASGSNEALKAQANEYVVLSKLEQGDVAGAKAFLNTQTGKDLCPPNSAEYFYIKAKAAQKSGDYIEAIQLASRIMTEQAQLSEWVARAELLCLELYFQLEMPESAASVLRDIEQFYLDQLVLKKAAAIAAQKK